MWKIPKQVVIDLTLFHKKIGRRVILFTFLPILFFYFLPKPKILPDSYIGKDVTTILKVMPKNDRKKLEYFFQELIAWGNFGYVIFGEKPMALEIVEERINPLESFSSFRHYLMPRRIKFNRGFTTWKKYEKFFKMKRFIFTYEGYNKNPMLVLINKSSFIILINKNKEYFNYLLKRNIEAEDLLEEAKTTPLISNLLMNHDALLGILLGYGKENSYLFHLKSQLTSEKEIFDFCEKFQFDSVWTPTEFEEFRKKFETINWISNYITGAHMKNLELMALPGFGGVFSSSETQYLRKHYLETKNLIIEFYKDKNFLEETLKILTS